MLRRTRWLLPLVVLLAWAPSAALAAPPLKDRVYRGVIHSKGWQNEAYAYSLRISFHVSADGRTAGPIQLPDGIPASERCAMGPLGTPHADTARIARGRFSIREQLHLPPPNDHGLGYVTVSGGFRRHGRFSGTITNRTSSTACQTSMAFTAQAAPKPKPPARSERSCSDTRENQWETASFRFRELHQTVRQGGPAGQPPIIDDLEPPRERTFGEVRIGAATCRSPHGWRVISPVNVRPYSQGLHNDADDPAEPRGSGSVKGWGIAVERMRNGVLQVRAMACRKGHLWALVDALRGFPLPVPYVVSLTQWAVNESTHLPHDGVRCADLGTDRLVVKAGSDGALRVREYDPALGEIVEESRPEPDFTTRYSRIINRVTISRGRH